MLLKPRPKDPAQRPGVRHEHAPLRLTTQRLWSVHRDCFRGGRMLGGGFLSPLRSVGGTVGSDARHTLFGSGEVQSTQQALGCAQGDVNAVSPWQAVPKAT